MRADLLIIGGGPAGLSAAVNAAAEGLRTVLWEASDRFGGQAGSSSRIENVIGHPEGISGPDLMSSTVAQAKRLGARLMTSHRLVALAQPSEEGGLWQADGLASGVPVALNARSVLLATGADWRALDCPGGDSAICQYGAMPEVLTQYSGQDVLVIGGANSAGQAAVHLAEHGAAVFLVVRRRLRDSMSAYLADRIESSAWVEVIENATVARIEHKGATADVTLSNGDGMRVSAVFPFIGADPASNIAAPYVITDKKGAIVSRDGYATGSAGLFVVGDVRADATHRVATAAGEGAAVIAQVLHYLERT